jgi:hypothetical protein
VVYDGVEHLAGPLAIGLQSEANPSPTRIYGPQNDNLGLATSVTLSDELADSTEFAFTACKSWVTVTHRLHQMTREGTLVFSLPLRAIDETPICDFGVGDGVYEKIAGDAVMWTTEFGQRPFAKWRVSTVNAGQERIDYQGEYATREEFAGRSWFHWIERAKALAVAIPPPLPPGMERLVVTICRNGKIDIEFTQPSDATGAIVSVCYHFLNDIPAIAAATNPASILLPPIVEITPPA